MNVFNEVLRYNTTDSLINYNAYNICSYDGSQSFFMMRFMSFQLGSKTRNYQIQFLWHYNCNSFSNLSRCLKPFYPQQ